MFGRLSQLAQNVQSSFNADESGNAGEGGGATPSKSSVSELEKKVAHLQADLDQAEERNKSINAAFKKLLKEKEQEIKRLKESGTGKVTEKMADNPDVNDMNISMESLNQLKRKTEEYQMLLEQKDQTIQVLMGDVKEAEDLRDKVEKQERINTEKLMFELAERIRAHETIQRKLEETRHVMSEKDNAIHNMADQMAAQAELLKAREDSIKKLKRMATGGEASEEMIVTLQKAVQEKDNKMSQMAQLVDKLEVEKKLLDAKINNRDGLETSKDQTIKTLWSEIEQKNEMIQKMSTENKDLIAEIEKKEQETKVKLDLVGEKESVIDELSTRIRSLEKEMSFNKSDIEVSAEGASREIGHLKNQLSELNEILKSKTQTIDMFQKEIDEKDALHSELRQKLNTLQNSLLENEEKYQDQVRISKSLERERDEFREKHETEASEKSKIKEQLDKVGSELSEQLDHELSKAAQLMQKLEALKEENSKLREDKDVYAQQLVNCQEVGKTKAAELDGQQEKLEELEKEVEKLKKEVETKSNELKDVRNDLETKVEEIKKKDQQIEARDNEIQDQRDRFDAELSMLKTATQNEKGNTANLLEELEHVRRELESVNQMREELQGENQQFGKQLRERDSMLVEVQENLQSAQGENFELKEAMKSLNEKTSEAEAFNEKLRAEIVCLKEELEGQGRSSDELQEECQRLRKEVEEKDLVFEEERNQSKLLEEENNNLRGLQKTLDEQNKKVAEIEKVNEILKADKEKEKEISESKMSVLKSEYLELGEKVKEMEASMNHMVEKLNMAEMQMNESMQEKDSLEEKLKQAADERAVLATQKTDIEAALEEFVRTTESRKKRSGRSSTDDSDGARLTPSEGLSGYNTPISKEGSPRNSANLENLPATALQPQIVGSMLEGKAISEIFRLVEEERKSLEANLSSVTKERDVLSVRNSELEDYVELEKQKFKQASDEISQVKLTSQEMEDEFRDQLFRLQEELSNTRYANEEFAIKVKEDAESLEEYRLNVEKLEHELRQVEDRLADKTLELSRLNESCDHMQSELAGREEQLEKTSKQNKQMKIKLKELLKDRAEKEKILNEKESRIEELSGVSLRLNDSVAEIERLEIDLREKESRIGSLEEESNSKLSDIKNLTEKVLELEDEANRFREMSSHELLSVNEKAAELERSYREVEDNRITLQGEVNAKTQEIEDLNSILVVQKEEVGHLKELVLRKDEELAVTKTNMGNQEQRINELSTDLEKLNASLQTSEGTIATLENQAEDSKAVIENVNNDVEAQKEQNARLMEYISKLEEDLSEVNEESLKTNERLAASEKQREEVLAANSQMEDEHRLFRENVSLREKEVTKVMEDMKAKLQKSEEDMNTKEKEIEGLKLERDDFDVKVRGLEEMLVGKDTGLKEIVESKNNEIEVLKEDGRALNTELQEARKSAEDFEQRLVRAETNLAESELRFSEEQRTMDKKLEKKNIELSDKANELEELTTKCKENISMLEVVNSTLEHVRVSLKQMTEEKDAKEDELENARDRLSSLEKRITEIESEKENLMKYLNAKEEEVDELKRKFVSQTEYMNSQIEELESSKQSLEHQLNALQGDKNEGESQMVELMNNINEITRERDAALKNSIKLKEELVLLNSQFSQLNDERESLLSEKNVLSIAVNDLKAEKSDLENIYQENENVMKVKCEELDAIKSKLSSYEDEVENLRKANDEINNSLRLAEKNVTEVAEERESLNQSLDAAQETVSELRAKLQSFKDKDADLMHTVSCLELSVSEKDVELQKLSEKLNDVGATKKDLEDKVSGVEDLKTKLQEREDNCVVLENQIENLKKQVELSDQEFEAERDIFAAKISELRSLILTLEGKQAQYQEEIKDLNIKRAKIEDILSMKNQEIEDCKMKGDEEIAALKQVIEEKAKNFEEYKAKVLKKMKSMKEETKKLSNSNDELKGKADKIAEFELALEREQNERQSLETQVEAHRQKIAEMENLNVSREENLRNFETEISRYHRLLQDKDDEVMAVKEMMTSSIEELQNLQTDNHKKEEKIQILQEQLIANEDDLTASFSEKQNEIDEIKSSLERMTKNCAEKDTKIQDLTNMGSHQEETLAHLESLNLTLSNDLQAACEDKEQLKEANGGLNEKLEATNKELAETNAENQRLSNEISILKRDLAEKAREISDLNEESQKLRLDIQQKTTSESRNVEEEHLLQSSEGSVEKIPIGAKYESLVAEKDELGRRFDAVCEENRQMLLENKEKTADLELLTEQYETKVMELENLRAKPTNDLNEIVRPYAEQIETLQLEAEKKKKAVEEYKAKVSKRVKSLKDENHSLQSSVEELNKMLEEHKLNADESFSALEKENHSLVLQLEAAEQDVAKKQEVLDTSVSKAEELEAVAEKKKNEAESIRNEFAKLKQRLNDKEEEIFTVKEMMHSSISDMQSVYDELRKKDEIIQLLKDEASNKEEELNASILSLKGELSSMIEEHDLKVREHEDSVERLTESHKQLDVLQGMLDARNSEYERLKGEIEGGGTERGAVSEAQYDKEAKAKKEFMELEKESDAIKLKLAKAIKKLGTMKKEMQTKEELVSKLEEELRVWKSSAEEQPTERANVEEIQLQLEKSIGSITILNEELARKDEMTRELEEENAMLRAGQAVSESEIVTPSAQVSVYAEEANELSGFGPLDETDSSRVEEPVIEEVKVVTETTQAAPLEEYSQDMDRSVNEALKSEVDQLKKEKEELNESFKKASEQVEKAKKKIAALKRAEIKSGKENKELIKGLEEKNGNYETEIGALNSKLSAIDEILQEKEAEIGTFAEKAKFLQDELMQMGQLKTKLEGKNDDLKNLVQVMAEEKHELDDEMKDMLVEIKGVMDIKNKLLKDLEESDELLEKSKNEVLKLKEVLGMKEAELAANEWKLQELEALESELAEVREENSNLNGEVAARVSKLEAVENALKVKESEYIALVKELESVKEKSTREEEALSKLEKEMSVKDEAMQGLPSREDYQSMYEKIGLLSEQLKIKEEEVENLSRIAKDLEVDNQELKAVVERLEMQNKEKQRSENSSLVQLESLQKELASAKDELNHVLETSKKDKDALLTVESLTEELSQQKLSNEGLNCRLLEKDAELKEALTRLQELQEHEKEMKRMLGEGESARSFLEQECNALKQKQDESFKESDNEMSLLSATLEELRLTSSQTEATLNQEVQLLRERLEKEQHILNEKTKIERDELVQSCQETSQAVLDLEAKVQKLSENLEHKDTVIAKLKLKLKSTIKDRDVMKGNLQSEIERLSQEKDVIFNEFQSNAQQTDNEISLLKTRLEELESHNSDLEKELKSKKEMVKENEVESMAIREELANLRDMLQNNSTEKAALEAKIASLENEIEAKEDIIEKCEWESSEKEDKIRNLEREARLFQEEKEEWEELKRTFDDTIEVKDKIMVGLQKEIEKIQAKKFQDSNFKEEEMGDLKKENEELKGKIITYEDQSKKAKDDLSSLRENLTSFENLHAQIFDLIEVNFDTNGQKDIYKMISDYKNRQENALQSKADKIDSLVDELERTERSKVEVEGQLNEFQQQQKFALENCIDELKDTKDFRGEVSLPAVLSFLTSLTDDVKQENLQLNNEIAELKDSISELTINLENEKKSFAEFKEMNNEEKLLLLNEEIKKIDENLRESVKENKDLEVEVLNCQNQMQEKDALIYKLSAEKKDFEMRLTEAQSSIEILEMDVKGIEAEKENLERQVELLTQEADALNSATVPEMQAHLAAKNSAMLELRENFSEIMSDKDSVISTLRTKISELQQSISEGSSKNYEENEKLKSGIAEKDEVINKLRTELSNMKRNRDWLQSELSQTIKERNNIGGSLQNQFENISKGLRGDIEMFMEDKRTFETEFQLERLQLERKIAEQQHKIVELSRDIKSKEKDIIDLNFIVAELRLRVEAAADVLSKESYYQQLEERIEESYEKVNEASASVRDAMDKYREEKSKVEELEMKLKLSNRERGELVLVYEAKIAKMRSDNGKVYQSLQAELQLANQDKRTEIAHLEDSIEEIKRNNRFEIDSLLEKFDEEREGLKKRMKELSDDVGKLEREKEEAREKTLKEILNDADEKILKLRDDYEGLLLEKNHRLGDVTSKIEELEQKIFSLDQSNVTLSKSLFALEVENKKYEKEIKSLNKLYEEMTQKNKNDVEEILVRKGNDFKELRSQFEEALGAKEKILENLRDKVKKLNEVMEEKFQEINLLNAQKEELLEEDIKKELFHEKLKVSVDSLLNSVFEIPGEMRKQRRIIPELNPDEIETEAGSKLPKETRASDLTSSIMEAKSVVDKYLREVSKASSEPVVSPKGNSGDIYKLKEQIRVIEEENSRLRRSFDDQLKERAEFEQTEKHQHHVEDMEEKIEMLEQENRELRSSISQVKDNVTDVKHEAMDVAAAAPTSITQAIGVPRVFTGLQILASECNKGTEDDVDGTQKDASTEKGVEEDVIIPETSVTLDAGNEEPLKAVDIPALKEEVALLRSENQKAEVKLRNVENSVRKDFDDILQNLREDLQNAMNENRSLMAENFMLKNMDSNRMTPESHTGRQGEFGLIDATAKTVEESKETQVGRKIKESSSSEAFAQTDVSFVYQTADEFKRVAVLNESDRIKRYNTSERLPEVVEDTLYSKMELEQLQTFSDSTLEGESLAGHAKLELRLGEDTEDSDRSVSVADLQSEIEGLTAKVEQSKKLIVKLKHMSKKYKTELSELQAEKFEQIRVYEEAINGMKQELEEANLDKVRKYQEIRGLREEVRVLVKEKAEIADSIKARMDSINDSHQKAIADMIEENSQEFAKKDEVIRVLYNLKDENQKKTDNLGVQLRKALDTKEDILKLNTELKMGIDERDYELELNLKALNEKEAQCENLETRLRTAESEKLKLEEKLNVEKIDFAVDNAQFDEKIISDHLEVIDRTRIELEEAFDLIRALEFRQRELEEEFESRTEELSTIIDSQEETIGRMNEEKLGIEKSMQEMREDVQRTVEEKDNIVEHLRKEKRKVLEENELKFTEKIQMSQSSIEECQVEITALREQTALQDSQIEGLTAKIKEAEETAKDASEKINYYEGTLMGVQTELEHALQTKNLVEDRMAFFEHQIEGMRNEHENEVRKHQNEVEQSAIVIDNLQGVLTEKENLILGLENEIKSLKDEVAKNKKKAKRFKREMESVKRTSQELSDGIRIEMEKIVGEIHDEKADLYTNMLSKDRQLQELRVYADQLMSEKGQWSSRARETGPVQSEMLIGKYDGELGFPDAERLSLQINQLKHEKEKVAESLEEKISELKNEFFSMEKRKREGDLKIAELSAKLDHLQKQSKASETSQQQAKLQGYKAEVTNIKGEFDSLKKEASGFADASKMLLGKLENDLTGLIMNAAQKQMQMVPKPIPLSTAVVDAEVRSLSPVGRSIEGNDDLEVAKEQIAMLEDSLRTWKDRCTELEEQLQELSLGEEAALGRRGSREFLINIDDEGPSIESARPTFGTNAKRLMKYSTSGMRFKTRAKSFLSSLFGRQRGMLPAKRILLMGYLLVIHVLAFVTLYGFISG